MPALGVVGSAYATLGARIYLALFLLIVTLRRERRRPSGLHDVPFAIDAARVSALLRLGTPAAVQIVLEVGVFAAASALAGRITPVALAANQIVLNVASFVFMVPLGLNSAAAVRVGQAVGRGDSAGVRRAGWTALLLSGVFCVATTIVLVVMPQPFLRVFTSDAPLVALGATVLFYYALCLPFDGFQCVATGALRGLGNVRTPMFVNLVGHWAIGLPVAYVLCFPRGWGVVGLWVGLTLGLVLIGTVLVGVWYRDSRTAGR